MGATLKKHRRSALARAVDIECAAANVNRMADMWVPLAVPPFASLLVNETCEDKRDDKKSRSSGRP